MLIDCRVFEMFADYNLPSLVISKYPIMSSIKIRQTKFKD